MAEKMCFLTTFDNPFDPFTQFDDWFNFDCEKGYYSLAYLNRIARITPSMSEPEEDREYERAIDEIIKYDFRNMYTKKYVENNEPDPVVDESRSLDDLIAEYYATRSRGA